MIVKNIFYTIGVFLSSLILSIFQTKEIKDTKYFSFSYSVGYYANASYDYELKLENDKYIAGYKKEGVSEEDMLKKEVTKDDVLKLEKILSDNDIYKWNGYHKSDKNVLDGDGFSLSYRSTNNINISASGYMMYPKGYLNFKNDIISFYSELFDEK